VNVSARSLHDGRFVDDVTQALLANDLQPGQLQIEITEHALMSDTTRVREILSQLAARGVSVSIDDYGTGYFSLAHLRKLPVHELKIDKSFVMGMAAEDGAQDTAIVRSTADLAHNLGLTVVAEGVEDQWTLDLLSTLGCDEAQGYHIARPMPSADLVTWLGSASWRAGES
jgi:EAL domain-containing protein (putative c-di-GMP-specific phosphodiesterase class I)